LKKSYYSLFLTFLLFVPLFFNINHYHDWGDDFAQYIFQAKNFIHQNNSIHLIASEYFGPQQRGAGFSILLVPFYLFFGNSIFHFQVFISFSLFSLSIVLFSFFRKSIEIKSIITVSLLTLIFSYNYQILNHKMEIMYTFPFMFFIYLSFIFFELQSLKYFILFSILIGFVVSIANIGWVLFLASIICLLLNFSKTKSFYQKFLLIFSVPILVYGLIKFTMFNNFFGDELVWYKDVFSFQTFVNQIFSNIMYYKTQFHYFFEQEIWAWYNLLISIVILPLLFIGFYNRLIKKNINSITEYFFILYFLVLLIYPYQKAGVRFLIPIFPLAILYIYLGCVYLLGFFKVKDNSMIINVFLLAVLLSNTNLVL
jgi:hypothetical protein